MHEPQDQIPPDCDYDHTTTTVSSDLFTQFNMDRRRNVNIYDNPTPGTSAGTRASQASSQASTQIMSTQSSSQTLTQSTPASSSASSSSSGHDIDTVRELVRGILILNQTRIPFRRIDMAKMVDVKRMTDELIDEARKHLKQVFGYKLIAVENMETNFIVIRERRRSVFTPRARDTDTHDAVLILVLTCIFMTSETGCSIEKLKEFLSLISLDDETEIWNGNENIKVKDLIGRHWVKQLYLEKFDNEDLLTKRKETTMGWGFRARQEFDPKQMLDLVAEITGTPAHAWREQFSRAHEDDDADVTIVGSSQATSSSAAGLRSGSRVSAVSSGTRRAGATHRLVAGLNTGAPVLPVGRGILSESTRINRLPSSSSQSRR